MAKRNLKRLILSLIPSRKSKEEKEVIASRIMKCIGASSLNEKISQYDKKGNPGVFYDSKDQALFREEIREYLKKPEPPREDTIPQGKLEVKVKKRGRPPKTSREYEEDYSPPPNQITPKEACEYLEEKYKKSISQRDLKKIMQDMPLTRPSLDDAYKFKMFELMQISSVKSEFRVYEITINDQRGVPRYFCEREKILREFLKKK